MLLGLASLLDPAAADAWRWPGGTLVAAATAIIAAGSLAIAAWRTWRVGRELR